MKKSNLLTISVATMISLSIILFGALSSKSAYAQQEVIRLKFAFYPPAAIPLGQLLQEFCKDLEQRTGGRLKVDFYGGGSLLKAPQVYEGIVNGITDMAYCHIEYTSGRFPVTAARQLPLGYPSAWVSNQVANDFHEKFKPKEWNDVKVLWMHASPPLLMVTTKPVRKLEDLKGMIIRAPGLVGKVVKALGATPAPTPVMEVYDAMGKGVIQGVYIDYEALQAFRFAEVAKYITASWQVGNVYAFYIAMNKNSYNKLPPDIKEIFDKTTGEYREKFALVWNESEFYGKDAANKEKAEIIELPPDEVVRWQKAVAPVIGDYVDGMVAKGYSETEVRGWIKFVEDRIAYWTKKQIDYRILSPTGPAEMQH